MEETSQIDSDSPFERALTLLVATLACEQCPLYRKCVESQCKNCLREYFKEGSV